MNQFFNQFVAVYIYRLEYVLQALFIFLLHKLNKGSVQNRMRKYSEINIESSIEDSSNIDRIAIFVAYHDANTIPISNWNYIQALQQSGFKILYIHNGFLDKIVMNQLSQVCHNVICRPNIGSDCGAWKDAYLYYNRKGFFKNAEWLLFCNDSNYFIGGRNSNIFVDKFRELLLNSDKDLIALNKNLELWQHYQSFFLCFRRCIFTSQKFESFWKNYLPLNHRFYAINKCEIKLTRELLSKYKSQVIYDSSTLYYNLSLKEKVSSTEFLSFLPKNAMYLSNCVSDGYIYELELQKILAILGCHNPSHAFALLFVEYLNSPFIKKDLVKQGVFSIPQVQSTITRHVSSKENPDLIREIIDGYLSSGLNSSYLKYPRMAYRKGINSLNGTTFSGYGKALSQMGLS